jgi:hypothetical protein
LIHWWWLLHSTAPASWKLQQLAYFIYPLINHRGQFSCKEYYYLNVSKILSNSPRCVETGKTHWCINHYLCTNFFSIFIFYH